MLEEIYSLSPVSFPNRKFQKLLRNYNVYRQDNWPQLVTVIATLYLQFPIFSERQSFSFIVHAIEYNTGRVIACKQIRSSLGLTSCSVNPP